jgi:hypothetical protein
MHNIDVVRNLDLKPKKELSRKKHKESGGGPGWHGA